MSLNTGLTAIPEEDIAKHQSIAQSYVSKMVMLENDNGTSGTALAGTGRRFVSTVSTGGTRKTREVSLAAVIQQIRAEVPGMFSALPASAEAMYAPELRGNAAEWKAVISD